MATDESPDAPGAARPALRIVSGAPTPEELAAITAVVAAATTGSDPTDRRTARGGWNDPAHSRRPTLLPGPNAWRTALR